MSDDAKQVWLSAFSEEAGRGGICVIFAAAFGVGVGLLGLPLLTVGLFMAPLHTDFGWSRAQVSGASFCINIATLITAPLIGRLCDRIGVRTVAIGSLTALCIGFLLLSVMNGSIVAYYLLWLALAMGSVGTSGIVWTRAIGTIFDRNRGLALGLTLTGTAFAALLGPLALGPLIASFGWRGGYLGLAAITAVAVPVTYFFFFERSRDGGGGTDHSSEPNTPGFTMLEACKSASFWKMGIGLFLIVLGMGSFLVHFVALATDAGINLPTATRLFSIIGLSMLIGRVFIGVLLDRFHAAYVAGAALSLPAIACWILIGTGPSLPTFFLAAATIGFCAGAEIDIIAYLVSRYFGMRAYGGIYGCQMVFFAAGSGLGSVLTGYIRDVSHSYDPALYGGLFVFIAGALSIVSMGRLPTFGDEISNGEVQSASLSKSAA